MTDQLSKKERAEWVAEFKELERQGKLELALMIASMASELSSRPKSSIWSSTK